MPFLASFLGDRQFLAGMLLIVKSTSPKSMRVRNRI
jgi:hypothetical protein